MIFTFAACCARSRRVHRRRSASRTASSSSVPASPTEVRCLLVDVWAQGTDTIVPCVNDLCIGAGVSGKCYLVYGVPKCCTRDATVCHDSYAAGEDKLYRRTMADQHPWERRVTGDTALRPLGLGLDAVGLEHANVHRQQHASLQAANGMNTHYAIALIVVAAVFFIISLKLLICGSYSWTCICYFNTWPDEFDFPEKALADGHPERGSNEHLTTVGDDGGGSCTEHMKPSHSVISSLLQTSSHTENTALTPSTPGCTIMDCTVEMHEIKKSPIRRADTSQYTYIHQTSLLT